MGTINETEKDELAKQLAPWLRACVDHGLLKVWIAENAPDNIKEIYRNCYS